MDSALQPQGFQLWVVFQQDGAPSHWDLAVHQLFWTRDGSPDYTPLKFFFLLVWVGRWRGYTVFSLPVPDNENLKARITDATTNAIKDISESKKKIEISHIYSPGNKPSTCWSTSFKKTNPLSQGEKFATNYMFCILLSFLLLLLCVWNQGKTTLTLCERDVWTASLLLHLHVWRSTLYADTFLLLSP